MFEGFNRKDKSLTSLDLGEPKPWLKPPAPTSAPTPATDPKPESKAEVKPVGVPVCVMKAQTLEGEYEHFNGVRRRLEELTKTGMKPEIIFYIVFPQQGLSHSLTTNDGLKTIVMIFNTRMMAEAYTAARKIAAVVAACRLENLAKQAEHWATSGINSYALNVCCKCFSLAAMPLAELQSEDLFLATWRLDLANRRHFAEGFGRNTATVFASNPKQARAWLEGMRDHIDPANPYLHWMIALLAGLGGDMEANAASIKRLDAFGPPFTGKLQGTSFHPTEPGSQLRTMGEAIVGLGVSLGYVDVNKLSQVPKA